MKGGRGRSAIMERERGGRGEEGMKEARGGGGQ